MEIYKNLSDPASKEFEQLLNTHQSKTPTEEGKIIEGVINKITEINNAALRFIPSVQTYQ